MESAEDALGTAMLDFQRGGLRGGAIHRDGAETWPAFVEENYFGNEGAGLDLDTVDERWRSLYDSFEGPLLDVGCGAGHHALGFQRRFETVAFDVSPNAVRAARERGVEDARVQDMFDLTEAFETSRFASVLCNGTQLGLAGSLAGVSSLLADFGRVTTDDAVALLDSYDPSRIDEETADEFGGYRPDPRAGVCGRTFHVEYDRGVDDGYERLVGPTLSFVLFSPDRLRDACVGTPWHVAEITHRDGYYKALLGKT
ncbi:class I SAM-dependent methyltransferase [Halomarina oriensis]|uniref:Methyltransferase domain-containing protein n=1 Tax=Halomarina oriensis TaxID=671145 RepID=A0A6B0GNZ7_9EURY|nr:class I SAM-dependent methyltransferase [Halomarina oriensis]MWG36656.1 methyltransferase domain-containing protein [Halomarina oriensis]